MRYFWLRFFVLLFFTNYVKIMNGAEAPMNENEDKNSALSLVKKEIVNIQGLQDAIQLIDGVADAKYLLELTFINLAKILEAMIKFLTIYKNEIRNEHAFLNGCFQSMFLNSLFERSDEMVSKAKEKLLLDYSCNSKPELFTKLTEMHGNVSPRYFEFLVDNRNELESEANKLMFKLNILLSFEANEEFVTFVFSILDLGKYVLDLFGNYSNIHLNSSRRERSKLFISNRHNFGLFDINYHSPFLKLSQVSFEKSEENRELATKFVNYLDSRNSDEEFDKVAITAGFYLYDNYFGSQGLTEVQVLRVELLALTAIYNLRASMFLIYMFGGDSDKWTTDIERCNVEILNMMSVRGTSLRVEEEVVELIKVEVRNMLGYSEIQSNNMVRTGFDRSLEKDEILTKSMNLYALLLKSLLLLKNEREKVSSSKYLKKILDLTINLLEPSIKEFLSQIRFNKQNLSAEQMQIKQSTLFRERLKDRREKVKQDRLKKLDLYRKERKEMEKRKQQEEEKERIERNEARRKLKEEKSKKKKHKEKRKFPEACQSSERRDLSNEECVEHRRSRSRSRSRPRPRPTSPGSQLSFNISKPKSERRREKLEKLLQEEAKSIQKEVIKQTIQMQKSKYESPKKRKQVDRKNRNEDRREKEERERVEERERERQAEKERQDRIQHGNYMYSLLNSIDSIEGLYIEAQKSQESLQGLISFVFSALLDDIEAEERAEEKLLSSLAAVSILEKDHASSSRQRRRTDEASRSTENISSLDMNSRGAISTTRSGILPSVVSSSFLSNGLSESRVRRLARKSSRSRERSKSVPNSRIRSSSNSRSTLRRISRSVSRPRKAVNQMDASQTRSEVSFDGFCVPYISDFDAKQDRSARNSKFMRFFSSNRDSGSDLTALDQLSLEVLGLNIECSNISENSTIEEIQTSLEVCGNKIQLLHLEIAPSLTGKDFFRAKLIEKELIKKFTEQLLLLQKKRNS
ncbi:signal peptide protein [Cryptosporidium sp. chipmunk genotype I]|uniref:signal peptide protein n=1 Tax=Cryptosporidium sp. chipmunk genotype I TaxID=1280935 RepID=UPI00351A33B7|nr:signal peptide protein [Cryptosporidium sp. chipmunk genotype I]